MTDTVVVNSNSYVNGASDTALEIFADVSEGLSNTSVVNGTVALDATKVTNSAVGQNDATTITATSGVVNVAYSNGDAATINALNDGDKFTVQSDGEENAVEYVKNANGLIYSTSETTSYINKSVTSSVAVADLTDMDKWQGMVLVTGDVLKLDADTLANGATALMVDNLTDTTKIYGTITKSEDGSTYTVSKDDATAGTALSSIEMTDTQVTFTKDFANIEMKSGGSQFTATTAEDGFTVSGTSVTGATAITLTSGSLTSVESSTVVTTSGSTVQDNIGGYTVTVSGTDTTVSNVTASDTTLTITGNATVQTANLHNKELEYTFGSQVFKVANDTDEDGVYFVVSDSSVTKVGGLDVQGLVTMTSTSVVQVNDKIGTDGKVEDTFSGTGVKVVGTGSANGADAAELVTGKSYYVVIGTDDTMTLYEVNSSTKEVGTVVETTDLVFSNTAISIDNEGLIPSTEDGNIIVVANNSNKEISFTGYIKGLTTLSEGMAVQLVNTNTLAVVKASQGQEITLATETLTTGTIAIPASKTLNAGDLNITSASSETNVINFATREFNGAGMIIEGTGEFNLVATASTAYTVNSNALTVIETSKLTADTTDTLVLNSGTVQVTQNIAVAAGTFAVSGDSDGVRVVADTDGTVSAITMLTSGGTVTFTDRSNAVTTYEMKGTNLVVTDSENNVKVYANSGESTNILNLTNASSMAYVQVKDNVINISDGLSAATASDTAIIYGTGTTYAADEVVAKLDKDTFKLESDTALTSDMTVTAVGANITTLTTNFTADVTTPATTDTITVNSQSYTSTDGSSLTIAATATGSTLKDGTVTLQSNTSVVPSTDTQVTATVGNVTVKVTNGMIDEIGDIATTETFGVGTDTYVQNAAGLIKDGASILEGSGATFKPNAENDWAKIITIDASSILDLSNVEDEKAVVFDNTTATKIADLALSSNTKTFTISNATADVISTVKLGNTVTTLNAPFEVQVATTGDAKVNNVSFDATSDTSSLTINATSRSATLYNGTVHLDSTSTDTKAVTISDTTITATGTEIDVTATNGSATSVADIDVDETFTINNDTYEMKGIGLIKNGTQFLKDSAYNDYTYNLNDENWQGAVFLSDTGIINLNGVTDTTVYVASDLSKVIATYTPGVDGAAGTLEAGDKANADDVKAFVKNITLGSNSVTFGTVFANGETEIKSGNDTFEVEASTSAFTVTPASGSSATAVTGASGITLDGGKVAVADGTKVYLAGNGGDSNTKYVQGTDGDGVTVAISGNTITVTSLEGTTTGTLETNTAIKIEPNGEGKFSIGNSVKTDVTIKGDDDDSVNLVFETDSDGKLISVTGLDEGTEIELENDDEEISVSINNNTVTIPQGESKAYVGTENGTNIQEVESNPNYYIEVLSGGMSVYNLVDNKPGTEISNTSSIPATYSNGTVVLKAGIDPDKGTVIVKSERDLTVKKENGGDFIYVTALNGMAVQITNSDATVLKLTDETFVNNTEIPTSGTVAVVDNVTLKVTDVITLKATAAESVTSTAQVTFGESGAITLKGEVGYTFTTASGAMVVSGDSGNLAIVMDGSSNLTSITELSIGGTVTYGGNTYTMSKVGDTIQLSKNDKVFQTYNGAKITSAEAVDLLKLSDEEAMDYVQVPVDESGTVIEPVTLDPTGNTIYGTKAPGEELTADDIIATATVNTETGVVDIAAGKAADGKDIDVDTTGIDNVKEVNTDFAADVEIKPTSSDTSYVPVTVNGDTYVPASGDNVVVGTTKDGDTALEEGSVIATSDTKVGDINGGSDTTVETVGVNGGDGVILTASDSKLTEIGDLEKDEIVTYGDDTLTGVSDAAVVTVTETTDSDTSDTAVTYGISDAPVKVDDATIIPSGTATVPVTPVDSDTFIIGQETLQVVGDDDYSVTADENGVNEVDGIDSGTAVSVSGDADISTTGDGTYTINGSEYDVDEEEGKEDGVTFGVEGTGSDAKVASIDDLNGTVEGDFTDGINVNGEKVQVTGDDDSDVKVTSTTDTGVSEIAGVNGSDVSIVLGNNDPQTFGITDDPDGVTFDVNTETGIIDGVEDLEGNLAMSGTGRAFTVNGSDTLTVAAGDDVTLSTGSDSALTGVAGVSESIDGVPVNASVGVDEPNVTVNGTKLDVDEGNDSLGNNDTDYTVKLAEDSDGKAVPATIEGLGDGTTVKNAPDMDIVTDEFGTFLIGSTPVTIAGDEQVGLKTGSDGDLNAIESLEGTAEITGDETLNVNGQEVGIDKATGNNSPVTIAGSENGNGVDSIGGLQDGDSISGNSDTGLAGVAIAMPGGVSDSDTVTLTIDGHEYELAGDEDGVTITQGEGDAPTSITGLADNSTLQVGEDGDYVVTNEEGDTDTLKGAKADEEIIVDKDGGISVYDSDSFVADGTADADAIVEQIAKDPYGYTNYSSSLKADQKPETSYDSDASLSTDTNVYNTDTAFALANTGTDTAVYDFSDNTGKKRVSLEGGDQELKFNDDGDNVAVVADNASGTQRIELGNGGDNVVVGSGNNGEVTVEAGTGKDDIVSKSDITVETNDSGTTKVTPLNDATITLDGYGNEEYENGTGVQTDLGNIARAVRSGSIAFGEGDASIKGNGDKSNGTVVFDPDDDVNKVNFYDKKGDLTKVGFTGSDGGLVDMSNEGSDTEVVMVGNWPSNSDTSASTLLGGDANDTVFAGAGDQIDAGAGDNVIYLDPERDKEDDGAVVSVTADDSNNTVKGFNFGSDDSADELNTGDFAIHGVTADGDDLNISLSEKGKVKGNVKIEDGVGENIKFNNDYTDDTVVAQFGNDALTMDGEAEYFWAIGSDATVSVSDAFSASDTLNIDLTDHSYNDATANKPGFYGDIKEVDASGFEGKATITGNSDSNVIKASKGGSELDGGKGNDTIVAGESQDTITVGEGKDVVQGFGFDGEDLLSTDKIIRNASVSGNDVVLALGTDTANADTVTLKDAVGKNVTFDNQKTDEPVNVQFGKNAMEVTDDATFYWAAGDKATVSIGDGYTNNTADVDLTNAKYNNPDKLGFYGDIKELDASGYEGDATLKGNKNDNVIRAGSGDNLIDGGKGNDTLVGGAGDDTFKVGDGEDVIRNFGFEGDESGEDLLSTDKIIRSASVSGNDVVLTLGTDTEKADTVTIKDAAGKNVKFDNQKTDKPVDVQFGKNAMEVTDDATFYWATGEKATVSIGDEYTEDTLNVDLTNAKYNNPDKLGFYGDIKEIDASGYEGDATLKGNRKDNVIKAGSGDTTLEGGKGNDTLYGGAGADEFIYNDGDGSDRIRNFTAGTGENADKLNVGEKAVSTVAVSGDNVILTLGEEKITIDGVAGESFQLENKYTDGTVNLKVDNKKLELDDDATFYWAAGEDATVTMADFTADSVTVDLNNKNFKDTDNLGFYGNIKAVNASGYEGDVNITGKKNTNNVLTGGDGHSTLWGGEGGNDTLIGGDGEDTFIYKAGGGNDVIKGTSANDVIKLDGLTLADLKETGNALIVGNDVQINLKDGSGSLMVEKGAISGVTFEIGGKQYTVNKDTKQWNS